MCYNWRKLFFEWLYQKEHNEYICRGFQYSKFSFRCLVWSTCALTVIILQLVTTGCRKLHRVDWSINAKGPFGQTYQIQKISEKINFKNAVLLRTVNLRSDLIEETKALSWIAFSYSTATGHRKPRRGQRPRKNRDRDQMQFFSWGNQPSTDRGLPLFSAFHTRFAKNRVRVKHL